MTPKRPESLSQILPYWYLVTAWTMGTIGLVFFQRFFSIAFAHVSLPCALLSMLLLRSVFAVFCLAGIALILRKNRRLLGVGISIPLLIFWGLLCARYLFESHHHLIPSASGDWRDVFKALNAIGITTVVVLLMSCKAPKRLEKSLFYFAIIPLLIILTYASLVWGQYLLAGYSARDNAFFLSLYPDRSVYSVKASLVRFISLTGGVSASLFLWGWAESKIKLRYFIPLYALSVPWLYFGGTRSNMVAMILTHALILILTDLRKRRRFWIVLLVVLASNAVAMGYVGQNGRHPMLKRSVQTGGEFQDLVAFHDEEYVDDEGWESMSPEKTVAPKGPGRKVARGRSTIWRDTVAKIAQHPLTGYGFSPYKFEDKKKAPHNLYLEAFLATGVIGGTLLLFVVATAFKDAWTCLKKAPQLGWVACLFFDTAFQVFFRESPTNAVLLYSSIVILHAQAGAVRSESLLSEVEPIDPV